MNGNKNGRPSKTRITGAFKLSPTTHAIRAALAISFTVLGLSGSGLALAGTCLANPAPNTISCNGDFANLPDASFAPVVDMTLILGDTAPTSVTPAGGTVGVEASWGGNVGLVSHADITSVGADGVHQYGSTSAMLNNDGSITTNVTAAGANAVDISAYGDVSVVNNGPVDAYSAGVYDVTAVNAYSVDGKITIDNQSAGTISAIAQDGNAIALYASAFGDNVVSNEGIITAYSFNGIAVGAVAQAYTGDVSVTNSGSISATSINYQAVGLIASSNNGYATVSNAGTIRASGGQDQAIGISASAGLGSSVDNTGQVYATSALGESIGISAQTYNGIASVTNSGSIFSKNSGPYAAIGILASSVNGTATIDNSGFVQSVNFHGDGIGLEADSAAGSTIANSSYVLGGSYNANGTGLLATATSGDVAITNGASGYVRGVSFGANYFEAIGVSAHSTDGKVSVNNDGRIFVLTTDGKATGIQAFGGDDVYVGNTGYVAGHNGANSGGYNDGRGISAMSYNGAVSVVNSGSVFGYSPVRLGLFTGKTTVDGIVAVSRAGAFNSEGTYGPTAVTTVVNSGYVNATGAWFVNGIAAGSYGGTSVTNTQSGSIIATGLNPIGIEVVETPNSYANFGFGAVTVDNAGSIMVNQVNDCACNGINPYGYGIKAVSSFGGDIAVSNTGSIAVNTQHAGFGIYAYGVLGQTAVDNAASIIVSGAGSNGRQLFGEHVVSAYGSVSATNSGDITVVSPPIAGQNYVGSQAKGMYARSGRVGSPKYHGGGDATLINTGQILVDTTVGYGMWGNSQYAKAGVYNAGTITLNNDFVGVGMTATAGNPLYPGVGSVELDNTGSVSSNASNHSTGLRVFSSGAAFGDYPGIAIAVDNSGYVGVSSQQASQGILAFSSHDDIFTIDNSGRVVVNATINDRPGEYAGANASALGIHTTEYLGDATVANSGDIVAITHEDHQRAGAAAGIFADNGTPTRYLGLLGIGYGDIGVTNTGSISAFLASSNTLAPNPPDPHRPIASQSLSGPSNTASGILAASTYGDVAIINAGAISASAQSDHYAAGGTDNGVTTANGIAVASNVGNYNFTTVYSNVYIPGTGWTKEYDGVPSALTLGDINLTNTAAGSITAYAKSTDASGDTALANGISAVVTMGNYGGSLVSAGTGITINNAGMVSATAVVANDATGIAMANGISAINGSTDGFVHVRNTGTVYATATSPGVATATGISTTAHDITVALTKDSVVVATATGPGSVATGLFAAGANVSASNLGTIKGIATGTNSIATGAQLISPGALSFMNTGTLRARADHAVAVDLTSAASATLINTGSIIAVPNVLNTNGIAVKTSAPNAVIQNYGTLTGKLRNGTGNFSFTNFTGGIWNAAGISDFGAGNDFFRNVGIINLSGSTLNLGSLGALGSNRFTNAVGGVVTVAGSNTLAMGAATPNVFMNNGTLTFQNGGVGDTLAINGDFGGNGTIAMDVSGLHGTSDQLQISGNVQAGSVNRVNLRVLDDPTTATTLIPLITVGGTSVAGSFVLGTVVQNKSFLDVLVSTIDPSNATKDVFSLGLTQPKSSTASTSGSPVTPSTSPVQGEVSATAFGSRQAIGFAESVNGLSDLGTLAIAAAPGAQNLMASQIGTLQQRMGALSQPLKGGVSLWARVFGDSGTVDPTHSANNFGQGGHFGFDQSNTGEEIGVDVAFTDALKAGLLVAKGQANQHLDDGNAGSSRIKSTTGGAYATWISPTGMYLDASFRAMSFTSRLNAASGQAWVKGDADAFNLETGKTWTLDSGLQIAPQLQYTWNTVNHITSVSDTLAGFRSSDDTSSRGRLGVMVSKTYTAADAGTSWMPYVSVSAVHEFDGKNRYTIDDSFSGQTGTAGTSALVTAGVNVTMHKLSFYGGANWLDGGAMKSFLGGQVGLRYSW